MMSDTIEPIQTSGEQSAEAPSLESLMAKLTDPTIPGYGRTRLLDQIEAYHLANSKGAEQAATEQADTDIGEAFAPPESPTGYRFEHHLPPGVDIVNEEALGAFKSGLHDLGVPASIAAGAFADVARLHGEGAFASDDAYQAAAQIARQHMDRVHGEAAPAAIRDAMAFLDRAEKGGHLTSDVVDAILASPIALSQAAMLARHATRKR